MLFLCLSGGDGYGNAKIEEIQPHEVQVKGQPLKVILICFAVVIIECLFIAAISKFFNGLPQTDSLVIYTGIFLAIELVVCTAVIFYKLDNIKKAMII